jgi:predicted dehydrogenase
MTTSSSSRIAFLGAGNIAGPYATALARHPELTLVGIFDLDAAKRDAFAADHRCTSYSSLDALCANEPLIVVNLTSAPFHYATTRELLSRGQTVFSEKPLAMEHGQATELVDLARRQGVRLACAPSLWLGEAQLAAARAVIGGAIGNVKLIHAEVNQGRIESWHPAPTLFYQVGPVFDAGVYPLAYLTAIFGPIRSVTATSTTVMPERKTLAGEPFTVATADAWIVAARFADGPLLRLSCNFFVDSKTAPRWIDFHGQDGSLRLDDWVMPGSSLAQAPFGAPFTETAQARPLEIDWCLGVADLAAAIREGKGHRTTGEHAAHVVEVLEAIAASARSGQAVDIASEFPNPLASLSQ